MTALRYCASWAATAAWLAILAFLTLQGGDDTSALSLNIARWLAAILKQISRYEVSTFTLNIALRKSAHVIVFFILGLLMTNAIRATFISLKLRLVGTAAGAACVIVAVSSEFSKTFIPGRHCQWDEAALDIAAALAGVLIFMLLIKLRQRKKGSHDDNQRCALLNDPFYSVKNQTRLAKSIANAEARKLTVHELIDDEDECTECFQGDS